MPSPTAPLSENERRELEELLDRGEGESPPIQFIDGLFAALICSPILAKPDEWLPIVFGRRQPTWLSSGELKRIIDLLVRHWNEVAASLDDGTFVPVRGTWLDASGKKTVMPHHWCVGFIEGMQMHEAHWLDPGADELQELLTPIRRVWGDALAVLDNARGKKEKRLSSREVEELGEAIPDAVIELRAYWRRHPIAGVRKSGATPQPHAHEAPAREKGTWIAGLAEFPGFVEGEGPPYRPVMALVLDADGAVLGAAIKRPEERQEAIAEAVFTALNAPMAGDSERPQRVVVPADDVTALVARVLPGVEVIVGPTPELDEALESLRESVVPDDDERPTSLTADTTPETMASFFDAAADFYERAPWTIVPDDDSLLRVTSSKLGIRNAVACVIGQEQESYGVLLFDSFADLMKYRRLATRALGGDMATQGYPRHIAMSFERAAELSDAQRREISAHRWRVAGPAAFPVLMLIEPDMVLRPPTRDDYRRAEGLCRAISRLIDTEAGLPEAFGAGASIRRRVTVDVQGEPVSVTISVR